MAKQKESKQTEENRPSRGLHAYGGHDDASYHILHALYISGKTTDNGVEYAE